MQTQAISIGQQVVISGGLLLIVVLTLWLWYNSKKRLYTMVVKFSDKSAKTVKKYGFFPNNAQAKKQLLPLATIYFATEEHLDITITTAGRIVYSAVGVEILDIEA